MSAGVIVGYVILVALSAVSFQAYLRQKSRNKIQRAYTKEVEQKNAELKESLKESVFRESILEAKLNQIDIVLVRLGYNQLRDRVKPFLISDYKHKK